MKIGLVGAAVVTGYALGRMRKMKWALAIAAAAGGKRLAGQKGGLAAKAASLTGSPDLGGLSGDLRGHLVEAGKTAAATAVSRRIDSLSDSIHDRTQSLLSPAGTEDKDTEDGDTEDGGAEAGGPRAEPEEERQPAQGSRPPRGRDRPPSREKPRERPARRPEDTERGPARRRPAEQSAGRKRGERE